MLTGISLAVSLPNAPSSKLIVTPHMLKAVHAQVVETFKANSDAVLELMKFDSFVLDTAIQLIESVHDRLTRVHGLDDPRFDVRHALSLLKNIHQNASLKPHYQEMLNQCNVLLVSYFSAAIGDIFRYSITDAVRNGNRPDLLRQDVRISLRDVRDSADDFLERIGELFIAHRDISFQDMQSIGRSFREHLDCEIPKDERANDIIMSQACRHVTVHSGGNVDRKMIGQVRSAFPRTLKPALRNGEKIQFTDSEITLVATQMRSFLNEIILQLET